jgi:hypothetical protein
MTCRSTRTARSRECPGRLLPAHAFPDERTQLDGVEGYVNLVEEENRVPVGQPATASAPPSALQPTRPSQPLKKTEAVNAETRALISSRRWTSA